MCPTGHKRPLCRPADLRQARHHPWHRHVAARSWGGPRWEPVYSRWRCGLCGPVTCNRCRRGRPPPCSPPKPRDPLKRHRPWPLCCPRQRLRVHLLRWRRHRLSRPLRALQRPLQPRRPLRPGLRQPVRLHHRPRPRAGPTRHRWWQGPGPWNPLPPRCPLQRRRQRQRQPSWPLRRCALPNPPAPSIPACLGQARAGLTEPAGNGRPVRAARS